MGTTETNNLYLSYNDYHTMKSYFDSGIDFSYNKDIYDTVVKSLNIPLSRDSDFKEVLLKLMKYLSGNHAFYEFDKNHCCMYINYKLNKELKSLFYKMNDTIFKIFQDFVKKHDDEKRTKTCTSKLHYQDYTIVFQLELLYDLYDKLKYISTFNNNESFCDKLTDIVHKYNLHIDRFYEKDKNLFNKLKKFKELVEQLKLPPNCKCQEKIKQLKTPAKYFSDQELLKKQKIEQELEEKSQLEQSVQLPIIKSKELERENMEIGESVSSEDQNFIAPPEQAQDLTVLKHQSRLGDNKETRDFRHAEFTDAVETHETLTLSEPSYQTGYVRGTYILEKPTNDGEGILKSLQSTFSTIVDNVEPAPILGVSGGMGALYILLRYTPVGTFFGGRRRRNHLIPSGFPGAYPGFPEYFEGNLGNMPINISYQAE